MTSIAEKNQNFFEVSRSKRVRQGDDRAAKKLLFENGKALEKMTMQIAVKFLRKFFPICCSI